MNLDIESPAELAAKGLKKKPKKKKPFSATHYSMRECRKQGWSCAVVERWNPHAFVKQDLFGFADVVALTYPISGVLAIQACAAGDESKRRDKVAGVAHALEWLRCGNRVEVWVWHKKKKVRGGTAFTYTLRKHAARLEQLSDGTPVVRWSEAASDS